MVQFPENNRKELYKKIMGNGKYLNCKDQRKNPLYCVKKAGHIVVNLPNTSVHCKSCFIYLRTPVRISQYFL